MPYQHFSVGLRTPNYVIIGTNESNFKPKAININADNNKNAKISNKIGLACHGEPNDINKYVDRIRTHIHPKLYRQRVSMEDADGMIRCCRDIAVKSTLCDDVDLIVGGYDDFFKKTWLSTIEFNGPTSKNLEYVFKGFPGTDCYQIMKGLYRKDMTSEDAIKALCQCLSKAKPSLTSYSSFNFVIINNKGSTDLKHVPV